MDGRELLEAARAQQIDVPVVIMTASTLAVDELASAGARACTSPSSWTSCWRV
jgi:CheY-like chemotaxis protein